MSQKHPVNCPHCGVRAGFLDKLKEYEKHPDKVREDQQRQREEQPPAEATQTEHHELERMNPRGARPGTRTTHANGSIYQKMPNGKWKYVGKEK